MVDDLWKFGKPVGVGGPWLDSEVRAGEPSDPYLLNGFDNKTVALSHESDSAVTITLQVDIDGTGTWVEYKSFRIEPRAELVEEFPQGFSAYWVRAVADQPTKASVVFSYE